MLYLIESGEYYKIGFTTNIKSRMSNYRTPNPNVILIAKIEGIKKDEIILHKLCSKYHYSNEWFYKNDEIKTLFTNYATCAWNDWEGIKTLIKNHINNITEHLNTCNIEDFLNIPTMDWKTKSKIKSFFADTSGLTLPKNYNGYKNIFDELIVNNTFNPLMYLTLLKENENPLTESIKQRSIDYFQWRKKYEHEKMEDRIKQYEEIKITCTNNIKQEYIDIGNIIKTFDDLIQKITNFEPPAL